MVIYNQLDDLTCTVLLHFQGFKKACEKGMLTGNKIAGIKMRLTDGKDSYLSICSIWKW